MTAPTPERTLEPRFQLPDGWRWHEFEYKGGTLRFGTVSPKDTIPDAIVIGLQGLSEFGEKYAEVAHDLLRRNLAFWMMDWRGQGGSGRYLANRSMRHSNGFDHDLDDLHYFLQEYVRHAAVHPDVGRVPLVMLAHSMGGNLGFRYLQAHPDAFACAAFSAPMIGIRSPMQCLPLRVQGAISAIFAVAARERYAIGSKDWVPLSQKKEFEILTSDPARMQVADILAHRDPKLQIGGITNGWLNAALRSCIDLDSSKQTIRTPFMIALAGQESLVSNAAARQFADRQPAPHEIFEIPGSKHEILMEVDSCRDAFFAGFDRLLHSVDIKNRLTPF